MQFEPRGFWVCFIKYSLNNKIKYGAITVWHLELTCSFNMFQTQVSYNDVQALFSVSCPTEGTGVWHKSTKITEWVCLKQLKFILSVIQLQNFTQDLLITSNWENVVGQRFPCFRTGLGWSLSKQRVCVTLTEVDAFSSKVVVFLVF